MIWNLFKKKDDDFRKHFLAVKSIKVDGVPFVIRKINVLDYLEGAKVLTEIFATYKITKDTTSFSEMDLANLNKLKKYLTDIICAGVVKPKFSREDSVIEGSEEIPIKDLFTDWILAQKLAQEIFDYTHGKKK